MNFFSKEQKHLERNFNQKLIKQNFFSPFSLEFACFECLCWSGRWSWCGLSGEPNEPCFDDKYYFLKKENLVDKSCVKLAGKFIIFNYKKERGRIGEKTNIERRTRKKNFINGDFLSKANWNKRDGGLKKSSNQIENQLKRKKATN